MAKRAGGNAHNLGEMLIQGLSSLISWLTTTGLQQPQKEMYLETVYPLAPKPEIKKGVTWADRASLAADAVVNSTKRINYQNFPAGGPVTSGNRYVFDTLAYFVDADGIRHQYRTQINSPGILTGTEVMQAFRGYWNSVQRDKYDITGKIPNRIASGEPVSITIIAAWRA